MRRNRERNDAVNSSPYILTEMAKGSTPMLFRPNSNTPPDSRYVVYTFPSSV